METSYYYYYYYYHYYYHHHYYYSRYEESFFSPKQDALFIVMQYCDAGDLSSRIKAAGSQLFAESKVLGW